MLQDYKLGLRMLLKYPGLTIAGGLALAIAIGIGAGWYDLVGKVVFPVIPLPDGDRIVAIDTRNLLTNQSELRVAHDFLEWRRELRTISELGAFRALPRHLFIGERAPERIQLAEITAAAFRAAHVSPLLGRLLVESDETPGAPGVIVLGYDVWQRAFAGRQDVIGSEVKVGETPATVVGVMPDGFKYPFNYHAWTPLQLRASYSPLEGGAMSVIGRLTPGITREQADAEVRALSERMATMRAATHEHLRSRVIRLDEPGDPGDPDVSDLAQFAITNLPVLLVLMIACMNVGTLVYARTATREGEIAVRTALGASRTRIVGQLFVETLVLVSLAAVVGLAAANRTLRWGIEGAYTDEGGIPFWITPGLSAATMVYAVGLAMTGAAMLSVLPALTVTRARVHTHLANLGSGGGTLRFGRLWTGAMIAQVTITAIGIPVAMESASRVARVDDIYAEFPSRDYLAARFEMDLPFDETARSSFEERRGRTLAEIERRVAMEPGVIAVSFADWVPGGTRGRGRIAAIESSTGGGAPFDYRFDTSSVGPGFFAVFERPIIAGRAFHSGDRTPAARSVIVNEAFVRGFVQRGGRGSPIGARLRYVERADATGLLPSAFVEARADTWYEIIGIVRDLGLDPNDEGEEAPQVFHAASLETMLPPVMHVHSRSDPGPLIARLPAIAAGVDPGVSIPEVGRLDDWIRDRTENARDPVAILAGVTMLTLFLSALGIFSLTSVNVSRRAREIGLRAALGANSRHVLLGILSRAAVVMGTGVVIAAVVVVITATAWKEDIAPFAWWLSTTAVVMLGTGLLASVVPARRALRINPADALKDI
jgi:putative ABC transport system permease protein